MRFCLDHEYYTQEWFKKIKAPEVITNGNDIRLPGIETALKIIIAGTELQHWYNKVATQVNKDMRLALTLVLYTGLRFAELTKLTGDDIVLDGAIPVIMVTSKGKGGAKEQQSIPDSIVEDMRALKERKQLFPITNGTCNLALKRGIKILKLDIPTFTVHKLRHIFANDLMENDINPYKLKGLMRHSKFATTETYYLHKDQTDLSKQVNIYNSLSRKSRSSAEKLDYYFKQFSRMAGEEMAVSIDKESGRITASII
ncbi:MAG: site-specific integrase [Patescibacteria group bacterium]